MRISDWSSDVCSSDLNSYIPLLKSFIERLIAPALLRGAESGEFRAHVDPERFYWMVFSMSTAPFLNTQVMCQASGLSFATESGVALWLRSITEFVLLSFRSEERRVGKECVST